MCIATVLMLMLNALKTSHCLPKLSQLDPKNPFTGFSSLKFPTIRPRIVPHPHVPVMTAQCGTASHFTKARKVIFFLKIHLSLSSLVQRQNYILASLHNSQVTLNHSYYAVVFLTVNDLNLSYLKIYF